MLIHVDSIHLKHQIGLRLHFHDPLGFASGRSPDPLVTGLLRARHEQVEGGWDVPGGRRGLSVPLLVARTSPTDKSYLHIYRISSYIIMISNTIT